MAIVQISQITNRKGLAENLPQLAGAEFGWSTDSRQLWIGNGTLEEGAPIIGNTEILTEFSDILNLSTTYTYKGEAAGYTVQTGPTVGTPVTLSLQNWFDQFASVLDFGAVANLSVGDTVAIANNTLAINRALYQLYCREVNPQIRRSLFFPAGVYLVDNSINIPPYATLYGEGADNSIISLVDGGGTVAYVAQTADSLQQTGTNISAGGATTPQYITITNLGFQSSDPLSSVFLVSQANNCRFQNVGFFGPNQTAPTENTNATIATDFATTSIKCEQIVFDGCVFNGTVYGVNTSQSLQGVAFTNSEFNTLYQGLLLGTSVPTSSGPTGVRITSNVFDNIYAEGIVFGAYSNLNASGHNIFYDVGNYTPGTGPATTIITLNNSNNVSVNDLFSRSDADAATYPRVYIGLAADFVSTTNGSQIVSATGTYVRQSGSQTEIINNGSGAVATVSINQAIAFEVNYTISGINTYPYRTGTLLVSSNNGSGDPIWSDDYVQNADTGVTLSVTQTGSTVTISYSSNGVLSANATINYSINYLA